MKLVLIHAFPLGPWMWREVTAPLHAATGAEVITPTLPGFGETAPLSQPPDLAHFADAILESVPGEFVAAGCSMGGYVVMELMRRAPDRLQGIVLLDTKPEADPDSARSRRLEIASGVESAGVDAWIDVLSAPLLGVTSRETRPDLMGEVVERIGATQPAGIAWAQRAMAGRPDSRGTLANWGRPALVVVGAEDELAPVATAREMAELLERGELAVINGAGHLAALEEPGQVAEAIASWWATSFPLGE